MIWYKKFFKPKKRLFILPHLIYAIAKIKIYLDSIKNLQFGTSKPNEAPHKLMDLTITTESEFKKLMGKGNTSMYKKTYLIYAPTIDSHTTLQ